MKISRYGFPKRACGLLDAWTPIMAEVETRERSERGKIGASAASEEKFHHFQSVSGHFPGISSTFLAHFSDILPVL